MFFGQAERARSAVACQHIQGNRNGRRRKKHVPLSCQLGKTRRASSQHRTHRARGATQFAQGTRLGSADGQHNKKTQRAQGAYRVYVVGLKRTLQKGFYNQSATFGFRVSAPLAAVGIRRVFRVQTLFKMQRFSQTTQRNAHRLAHNTGGIIC